jgi:hypothetical protein
VTIGTRAPADAWGQGRPVAYAWIEGCTGPGRPGVCVCVRQAGGRASGWARAWRATHRALVLSNLVPQPRDRGALAACVHIVARDSVHFLSQPAVLCA